MAIGWSDEELLASVEAYRQMEEKQSAGVNYSKKSVYEELSARFGRTAKAFEFRMQNISAVLEDLNLPWIPGLRPKVNVGAKTKIRLVKIIQDSRLEVQSVKSEFADLRTWEKALAAVMHLGGTATRKQVQDWITAQDSDYNIKNLADLYMMAVNAPARTGYSQNAKPRRTDQGSNYDKLFKVGEGIFEFYDPIQHGVWEIYPDASASNRFGVAIRLVSDPVEQAIKLAEEAERVAAVDFADIADSRSRVTAEIVRRRGQPAFRRALMVAYHEACAITGCSLPAVLEAAHVYPYKGDHTNDVSNGLLLRADIHTLFDLRMIAVETASMVVRISPKLVGTEYQALDGLPLRQPVEKRQRVGAEALDWHRSHCGW
ncbi:HNH endonuclease [Pseudomonas oryzihabitans]|uniref:Restriction endonuclease n=1 Tax=Pseudomonas oryzihabitans TaxID=47885 RepID=A0ABX3ISB4_9PSED|nr:HNH endonuclease [Pseudomonas psychrotolerans]ONN70633.1 restriction endonuclease [Pseudomonas psychrotolerans]